MWTAVRSGSIVKASSSRGTSIRSCLSYPAAPAPTPPRWRTLWWASMTTPMAGSSVGAMQAVPRSVWTSTSHRHATASAPRFPVTHLLLQPSTVVTASVGSWSHGGKARARPTSSVPSSRLSSTSKLTCCRGSCARETGVASMPFGLPTTDWSALKTPMKTCSWMNWKRPGSTEGHHPKLPLCSEGRLNIRLNTCFTRWLEREVHICGWVGCGI